MLPVVPFTRLFLDPNNAKTYYPSQICWYFYFLLHSCLVSFTFYLKFLLWNHWGSSAKNLPGEKRACAMSGNYTHSTGIHTIKTSLCPIQRNGKPAIFPNPPHSNFQKRIHSLWEPLWITLPCSLWQKSGLTRWKPCSIRFTQHWTACPKHLSHLLLLPGHTQNSLCAAVLLLYEA